MLELVLAAVPHSCCSPSRRMEICSRYGSNSTLYETRQLEIGGLFNYPKDGERRRKNGGRWRKDDERRLKTAADGRKTAKHS